MTRVDPERLHSNYFSNNARNDIEAAIMVKGDRRSNIASNTLSQPAPPTKTAQRELPSRRSIPKRCRIPAIYNVIRIGECVVGEAVKGEVDLPDAFLHGADESRQIAESILVLFAAFDARHRQDSVVENESDVGDISRCWAGQNLSD